MISIIKAAWENSKICHRCEFQGVCRWRGQGTKAEYLQNTERGSEAVGQKPCALHFIGKETKSQKLAGDKTSSTCS